MTTCKRYRCGRHVGSMIVRCKPRVDRYSECTAPTCLCTCRRRRGSSSCSSSTTRGDPRLSLPRPANAYRRLGRVALVQQAAARPVPRRSAFQHDSTLSLSLGFCDSNDTEQTVLVVFSDFVSLDLVFFSVSSQAVRYSKLTHVGFRAHVKIASRIVSYRIVLTRDWLGRTSSGT